MLWCSVERGSRGVVWGNASLRGGARRAVGLPEGPLRRLGGRYIGLHILMHAGVPTVESREEEDVLGAVGAAMQVVVWPRRRRRAASRILRMLQRLRRREPVVGSDTGKSLHTESRHCAVQVSFLDERSFKESTAIKKKHSIRLNSNKHKLTEYMHVYVTMKQCFIVWNNVWDIFFEMSGSLRQKYNLVHEDCMIHCNILVILSTCVRQAWREMYRKE